MTYLNDLIEALRAELRQYGELLARFDDAEEYSAGGTAKDEPVWAKALQEQEWIVELTLRRRERVQRQLACSLRLPQEAGLMELIPLLPRRHQLLVSALTDENKALSDRVQLRASEILPVVGHSLHLLEDHSLSPRSKRSYHKTDIPGDVPWPFCASRPHCGIRVETLTAPESAPSSSQAA